MYTDDTLGRMSLGTQEDRESLLLIVSGQRNWLTYHFGLFWLLNVPLVDLEL